MIYLCPSCGHDLPAGLADGIAFCGTCKYNLESSRHDKVMSAAWMCRRQQPDSIDGIARAVGLSEVEAILVESFVLDSLFSIDEFRAALKELGIGRRI